jgi:hypothetical protein
MLRLFRFADFFSRKPLDNSAERIERALFDRTRRLIAGVHVNQAFEAITGSLVVARGRGKSLRVLFCDSVRRPIPDVIRANFRELRDARSCGVEYRSCIGELADLQAVVVEELKLKASKYVDRILAISVSDSGMWQKDFEGETIYTGLCDATRLAERTGISVIDSWPDRDIAVGGKGYPLDPICLWLLQADRDRRIARKANISISVGEHAEGYLLPPSDGLDSEVPLLRCFRTEGMALIDGLLKLSAIDLQDATSTKQLLVSGVHSKELLSRWKQLENEEDRTSVMLELAMSPSGASLSTEHLLCTAMKWVSDELQSHVEESMKELKRDWEARRLELKRNLESSRRSTASGLEALGAFDRSSPDFEAPGNIMVEAPRLVSDTLVSRLQNRFLKTHVSCSWGEFLLRDTKDASNVEVDGPSLKAAMLGLLHIDQMPANIPSLTGADQQRILGRLTPGRPNSWRNLLREMADYEPSAMKLRDAV